MRPTLSIRKFINEGQLREFQKAIPEIQKEIMGQEKWESNDGSYGARGNTFRAYGVYVEGENTPSAIFRRWARRKTPQVLRTDPQLISSQDEFDLWHKKLGKSLQSYWQREESGKELSTAHKYKLVDLYIKWLTKHSLPEPSLNEMLIRFGHCALDLQSIRMINDHLSEILPIPSPSMGNVISENSYNFLQEIIREYCNIAGGTSLIFDYYAYKKGRR